MASKPGPLTGWPWEKLGNFKYLLLSPLVIKAVHTNFLGGQETDNISLLLLLLAATRYLHNQLWISISRYQNARSKRQIQSKSIHFEQVDRERSWDDYILMYTFMFILVHAYIPGASNLPLWNTKGLPVIFLAHIGPSEFVYYWAHRALHHHFLYNRYHSHHHSSFVTEPITSVVHPFAEHLMYAAMFSIAPLATVVTKTASLGLTFAYLIWFDFMNNMGHCNFEFVPSWAFKIFPPLKFLMYTPSFHSLHHSQVHTNFCLYMPLYDYLYGTADKSSETLYETAWKGRKEKVDLVYLTHATSLLSFFHLRFGFASFAAKPYSTKWYMWILWPISNAIMIFLWLFGRTFTSEKNRLNDLHLQTWVIPRYTFQYFMPSERARINKLLEDSILEAEKKEAKVINLGLLNQSEELNGGGELFLKRHKNLKIRMVDGSTLAAAVVLNSIPSETREVFMCGVTSKIGSAILSLLSERGVSIQLLTESRDQLDQMKSTVPSQFQHNIIPVSSYQAGKNCKIWIVGRWVSRKDQMKAPKGALFIPFLPFPIPRTRKDCTYYSTPAMRVPANLENVHTCENWLPRRVMSAWRVGGMVHAIQGWNYHECGQTMNTADINKVWEAALKHGFLPFNTSPAQLQLAF
ncbi:hypothetical protein SUGI_1194840 [Cryptomeria japonica]|uniref:very-long-chain aldehyde decarbonylase GL1-4 n=1 Tax=Cryptomeria japonica TaxID=3369 RepID=UPI0024146A46|nr:very-long-chain aldehyde decarbonylase GL1-4 [Cryptomeria japonica]GLJ55635.1 hypothetical protein SUGI_1194840 [Cryptomeria japonica]